MGDFNTIYKLITLADFIAGVIFMLVIIIV